MLPNQLPCHIYLCQTIKAIQKTWIIFVYIVIIYVAIQYPLEFAFDDHPIPNLVPDWFVNLVFFIDFLFGIARHKKIKKNVECEEIETKPWYRYLTITVDFIAALPLEMVTTPVFKLVKLIKLLKLQSVIMSLQHKMIQHASAFMVISFTFWFFVAVHVLSCIWHNLGIHHGQPDFLTDYIDSVYWTITTITSVGYGDITPETNMQKLFTIFVEILGFGVLTFIIGTVASSLMQKDPARKRYEENIEGLVSLMHYKSIPSSLKNKILSFYRYMWKNRLGYDETAFLHSLPENLQTEVALYLKKEVIEKVSIFQNASDAFKREIALVLKPVFLTPDDYVFKAGDRGKEMYFVVNGMLNTLTIDEQRVLTQLNAGDFFGEIALFKNQNRSATIKALTYCDIYALDKTSFDKVIARHPDIGEKIRATVEERESNYSI